MKSFKTLILATIVILSSTQLKAQNDSLSVLSNFIGAYKVINSSNGEEIEGKGSFRALMNEDGEALKYMLKSINSLNASKIIFWSGLAAGLGYYAIKWNNPEMREIPFIVVTGILSASTTFYFLSRKQARKSVAIYNKDHNLQKSQSFLQIGIHPTGIGLALNF